jgi:hypothetical protein
MGPDSPATLRPPPKKRQIICGTDAKVLTVAKKNGLRWRYWRTRYWGKLGRGFEILNEGIFEGV